MGSRATRKRKIGDEGGKKRRKGGQTNEQNSVQLKQMTVSEHILLVYCTGLGVFIKLFHGIGIIKCLQVLKIILFSSETFEGKSEEVP